MSNTKIDNKPKEIWKLGLPTKEGIYWLYGRIPSISIEEETLLLKVCKVANGFMYICNGRSMWEWEIKKGEPLFFIPAVIPSFDPNIVKAIL